MKAIKKLQNKKGFTLMEMLIVVAIMVILMAVSIPVFTNQLNKVKETTDDANLRAAKSTAITAVMTGDTTVTDGMMYDISEGKFITVPATIDDSDKGQSSDNSTKVIKVTITDGVATVDWATP